MARKRLKGSYHNYFGNLTLLVYRYMKQRKRQRQNKIAPWSGRKREKMKLLKVESENEDTLDAILMIVPDEYDKGKVLEASIDIADPTITQEIDIGDQEDFYLYHAYFG